MRQIDLNRPLWDVAISYERGTPVGSHGLPVPMSMRQHISMLHIDLNLEGFSGKAI